MSLEPGIVDANILVYAMAADAAQYAPSRALLDAARDDPASTLYVTSQILCEFYSVVTNPRRVMQARSTADVRASYYRLPRILACVADPRACR
jgi:predicted nucleic acid-binding protein